MELKNKPKGTSKASKRPTLAELKKRHPGYTRQLTMFLKIKRERFDNRKRSMAGEGRIIGHLECQRHEALLKALEKATLERLDFIGMYRSAFRKKCRKYKKGDYVLRYVSSPASWKHRAGVDCWVLYDHRTLRQKDSIRVRVS
jgi:hypothetical protein